MVLMPRKIKYRKSQKGKMRGIATKGNKMHFGDMDLRLLKMD